MTCVSCFIGLRYVEPLPSSSLLLVAFSMRCTSAIAPFEACAARLCTHTFSVGLILEPLEERVCDVIDVNSASDESAKESSYFHVRGSHL